MYRVDSNIVLESLLGQERTDEARTFLHNTPPQTLFITEFALYSICLALTRRQLDQTLRRFLDDLIDGEVNIIRLSPQDLKRVVTACEDFSLDFDDGYQYVAARIYGLTLVTFDRNFTRTDIERVSPSQLA